ncbi:hypothetical protein GW17_00012130 [Ensete ventricosum]|nr:hypothetical protein GW17_00012130 [Ensete ventricosum]
MPGLRSGSDSVEETASSGRLISKSTQPALAQSRMQAAGFTSPDGLTSSSSATNGGSVKWFVVCSERDGMLRALVALGTPGALVTVAGEGGNAIIYEELAHAGAALSSDAGCDGFAAGFVADAGSARIQRAARRQFRSGRSSSASSSIDHDNEQQSEDEAQSESSRIRHEKPISCLQTAASGDDDAIIGVKS